MEQQLLCPTHNQQIQIVCFNEQCQLFRFSCYECLNKEHHLSHIKELKTIQEFLEFKQQKQKEYQDFALQIKNDLDLIMNLLDEVREKLLKFDKYEMDTLDQMNDLLDLLLENQKVQNKYALIIVEQQQKLMSILKNYNSNLKETQINLQSQNSTQNILKYQLINKLKESPIYSFSFNNDSSILAAGYSSGQISIFELNQDKITKSQIVNQHSNAVYCLQFFHKKDWLISGSQDKMIIIWSFENKYWFCQQRIDAHSDWISHIIINKNDSLFISSSGDKTIQFWNQEEQWKRSQILTAHVNTVNSLSLNFAEDQLISCSCDQTIKVFGFQNSIWILLQTINVDKLGFRLCFIDNFTFVFQSEKSLELSIYKINETNEQYYLTKNISVQNDNHCSNLFPLKFVKAKNLILNKNGSKVILIKILNNGQFVEQEHIDFNTRYVYGVISNDGNYLTTWDQNSKYLQIRRVVE
ncbi:unnamed protein product [Paramecium sonneborni]|uniref:WD40-repeat-containing domain n=1 Tax=Paramecium sonneborni TaxID=65129 RepID=A0A8S1QUR8_9CILI|nr:unnamed protein product [Paramecium sonneborni]